MDRKQEYQEELQRMHNKDFSYSWVSTSSFLFYLQAFCFVALMLGGCYMLYTKRFHKADVNVQESTLYTPKYK